MNDPIDEGRDPSPLPMEDEDPEIEADWGSLLSEVEQGRYDDDPSPYDGTFSEHDLIGGDSDLRGEW